VNDRELLAAAREALRHARAPLTHFRVGAALLAGDGRVFRGCNVEDLIPSLSSCAERTALLKALSEGAADFRRIAIAAERADGASPEACYPCGACRQMLHGAAPGLVVVVGERDGRPLAHPLGDLLPHAFGADDVGGIGPA
jgi:cytidine deaminase